MISSDIENLVLGMGDKMRSRSRKLENTPACKGESVGRHLDSVMAAQVD